MFHTGESSSETGATFLRAHLGSGNSLNQVFQQGLKVLRSIFLKVSIFKRFRVQKKCKTDTTKNRATSLDFQPLLVSAGVLRELNRIHIVITLLSSWQKLCCMLATPLNRSKWPRFLAAKRCQSNKTKSHQNQIEAMALSTPGEFWAT